MFVLSGSKVVKGPCGLDPEPEGLMVYAVLKP